MDLRRPRPAHRPVQVAIVPGENDFAVIVDGALVLAVADELDAHHWAKHVTECV